LTIETNVHIALHKEHFEQIQLKNRTQIEQLQICGWIWQQKHIAKQKYLLEERQKNLYVICDDGHPQPTEMSSVLRNFGCLFSGMQKILTT
jgi:hypothetical protein